MILLAHIIIALSSVVFATYALFSPSQAKLNTSYGLVGATVASGTVLVVVSHAPVLSSCLSGLLYVGFTSVLIYFAHSKLAHEQADK